VLWATGFLAITGSPPFGTFVSELTILKAAVDQGRGFVAAAYLALLAVVFIGMANLVLPMAQGRAAERPETIPPREALWATLPPAALSALVVVLGIYVPPDLSAVLHEAARSLGGQ
jgi:hydrogenase-4 component F